jgi:uncharacterized lipoprotein YmbA
MKVSRWIPAAFAAVLAGCGSSPPLHYYALDVVTPAAAPAALNTPTLVHVRHISLPPEMDHRGLTYHQGTTRLNISDADQWSAPLADLIQATVTRDLGARLGYEKVLAAAAQGSGQANLDLDFVILSADDSCAISAQVNWTLSVPSGATRRGTLQMMAPAASCPAGMAAALSAALGELTDQLARQLTPS